MDQKRILWIVAAVGLFLLVVIGFALILYTPVKASQPVVTSIQSTNDIWATPQNATPIVPLSESTLSAQNDSLNNSLTSTLNNNQYNSQNILPSDSISLTGENPLGNTVNVNSSNTANVTANGQMPTTVQHVQDLTVISSNTKVYSNGTTTIDLTKEESTPKAQPVVVQEKVVEKKVSTPKATTQTKSTPKAVTKNTTTKNNTSSVKKQTTQPTPKFWIQAASYGSKKNAEEARDALLNEKIASEIFTFTDENGKLFYRVRVGPYTTKSEAEYWQTRISLIEKFSSTKTYITNSSAKAK